MAITNGYATLTEFKNYAEIDSTDSTDDGVIEKLIESASRYIDSKTNRFFYADTAATYYYTPEANDFLIVDPLYEVTTLKTDDDGDRTYENTWASTDYDLMPFNTDDSYHWIETTPDGNHHFPIVKKGVEIVGNFGYESVPSDIRTACLEISKTFYNRRSGQNFTGEAQVTAAGVVITPQDVTPLAGDIIKSHLRIV